MAAPPCHALQREVTAAFPGHSFSRKTTGETYKGHTGRKLWITQTERQGVTGSWEAAAWTFPPDRDTGKTGELNSQMEPEYIQLQSKYSSNYRHRKHMFLPHNYLHINSRDQSESLHIRTISLSSHKEKARFAVWRDKVRQRRRHRERLSFSDEKENLADALHLPLRYVFASCINISSLALSEAGVLHSQR